MVIIVLCHEDQQVVLFGTMASVMKQLRALCPEGPVIDVFSRGRVQ